MKPDEISSIALSSTVPGPDVTIKTGEPAPQDGSPAWETPALQELGAADDAFLIWEDPVLHDLGAADGVASYRVAGAVDGSPGYHHRS